MTDRVANPKISVIVPVYKVEKYLRECVESVLAQSFRDFELILVDDGSPDKSGEICEELAKKDSRIRVFHQENGGVTSARRLGVERARGEWINFVDADDLLPKDSLKDLFDEANDDTDWIHGWRQPFNDGETPREETRTGKVTSFDLVGLVENMLLHHTGPFAKIVRKKLFSPHVMGTPRSIRLGEDVQMNLRLIVNGPRNVKEIDKVVYCYRKGVGTTTTSSCIATEKYVFRYARLMLTETRKISTPDNRERILCALSRFWCGIVAWGVIGHRLQVKSPHRLATLIRRGAKRLKRFFLIYFCLRFKCLGIASLLARFYYFLRGRRLDMKNKTLLE